MRIDPPPVVSCQRLAHSLFIMKIDVVLYVLDGEHLLFTGQVSECPPIPRVGEEIRHGNLRVRLEGVQYRYQAESVEVALLA